MKFIDSRRLQGGVALVVSLLFLLVVTVISLIAASNSSMGLKMSSNMADASVSFQSAEAGAIAVLALAKDPANDPFQGADNKKPFANFDPASADYPLSNLNDGPDSMKRMEIYLTALGTSCPRSATGSSVGLLDCDYYRIESEHDMDKKARTQVTLGAVKTLIGSGGI